MNNELKQEIKNLIQELGLNCKVEDFETKMTKYMWEHVSWNENLSESFMEEYFDELDKCEISFNQKFSESFMEKHFDALDKRGLSFNQKLSESFMEKHFDALDKRGISECQILSESFMEKHFDALNKRRISWFQKLGEYFMEKHFNELDRRGVSRCQKLSESFMKKHKYKLDVKIQLKKHHAKKSNSAVYKYARKHDLKIENGYLYAFRNHDEFGRGSYSKTIFYEKGGVYRDWHCDLDPESENSFGLGIWPCGNTPVRIKVEDFGVEVVNNTWNGKARVWEFEVL